MHTVEVSNLSKSFGAVQAVADVSFSVAPGEIFGLLGPNGAGKTTTIRLMLDILKPDSGTVSILDGPMAEGKKDQIGYMPEERGLYQEMELEQCLVYLGTLKGVPAVVARRRAGEYLERFDLAQHRRKKVKELSRGMQQKAQIINTVLPDPELIIVDEPFSGLDPVNTQLVKELLRNLRQQGKTIIMSTHMMQQVEELCDRIVLINKGRNVLYGPLEQVQRDYSGHDDKIIGALGIALLQIAVWALCFAGAVWLGGALGIGWMQNLHPDWGNMARIFVVGAPVYLLMAALMTAIGATLVDSQDAQQAGPFYLLVLYIPLFLIGSIGNNPNGPTALALSFFPPTAITAYALRMVFAAVPWWQIGVTSAIALFAGLLMLWLAGKVLRLSMLRYGQRLRWRELWARQPAPEKGSTDPRLAGGGRRA